MNLFYVLEMKPEHDNKNVIYYAGWIDRLNHVHYEPREAITTYIEFAARWIREEIAWDVLQGLPNPSHFTVKEHSY